MTALLTALCSVIVFLHKQLLREKDERIEDLKRLAYRATDVTELVVSDKERARAKR